MSSVDRSDPDCPRTGVCARGLVKSFRDTEVIKGLDMTVEPGTIVGLIGPSGCGKTTTVRMLTGLLTPTSGLATVDGTNATELSARERARLGYLPQTPALFPDLSLAENLSFHASMYGLPLRRRRRLDEVLEWVELADDRKKLVADSSGGMQRRLALAAAFVHDPDIVFLDEPTAGIDPILREKFWETFRAAADDGKTLVVTTQYVGEAGECDVVGLLSDGELLIYDTPDHLRRAAFDGAVLEVTLRRPATDEEVDDLDRELEVVTSIERSGPRRLLVVVDDPDTSTDDLEHGLRRVGLDIDRIAEHVVEFDEAFVRIVERHRNGSAERGGRSSDQPADRGERPSDRDREVTGAGATG